MYLQRLAIPLLIKLFTFPPHNLDAHHLIRKHQLTKIELQVSLMKNSLHLLVIVSVPVFDVSYLSKCAINISCSTKIPNLTSADFLVATKEASYSG